MRSNLVLGASGAVGRFLLPRLVARGERVIGVSRHPQTASDAQTEWLRGDLFGAMPDLPAVDVVYSLGPLDAFVDWFVRTCASGAPARTMPLRVIALSSMSVQSKRLSVDAAERELAARLAAAEQRLFDGARAHAIACTVFRPTLIYGGGRDASLAPLARFARRWRVLPIPHGADGLRQPVHAGDLADACIAARDVAATHGKIYPLGGGERLRFDALLARIAAGPPRLALALPLPRAVVSLGLRALRKRGVLSRLRAPLVADNTAAARDFGFAPRAFIAQDVAADLAAPASLAAK